MSDHTKRQLDATLCRIVGDFGSAMKHADKLEDYELYETLRQKMIEIADLRDRLRLEPE